MAKPRSKEHLSNSGGNIEYPSTAILDYPEISVFAKPGLQIDSQPVPASQENSSAEETFDFAGTECKRRKDNTSSARTKVENYQKAAEFDVSTGSSSDWIDESLVFYQLTDAYGQPLNNAGLDYVSRPQNRLVMLLRRHPAGSFKQCDPTDIVIFKNMRDFKNDSASPLNVIDTFENVAGSDANDLLLSVLWELGFRSIYH